MSTPLIEEEKKPDVDFPGQKKKTDQETGDQCDTNVGHGSCKGHEDSFPPHVFKKPGVDGNGFGPSEIEEKKTDGPDRVDMGYGVQGQPAGHLGRRVSELESRPAVSVLMDCDGKKENRNLDNPL